jgi:Flp pilus assembly protein TadG
MYDLLRHRNNAHSNAAGARLRRVVAQARCERGQALVEFALVVPILLAVVIGIVDFGRAMNYDEQATHLANEAVRYAAVGQVPPGATGTLAQWVRSQADTPELQNGTGSVGAPPAVCVKYPDGTSNPGDPVEVSMSFVFNWVPFLHLTSTTITRTATMRIEQAPSGSFWTAC